MATRIAQVEFHLSWQSGLARHTDAYFAPTVNFWRDLLPPGLEALEQAAPGTRVSAPVRAGDSIPEAEKARIVQVRPEQFSGEYAPGQPVVPRQGRHYPIGMLSGLDGYYKGDMRPARCLEATDDHLVFDLNHPLASRPMTLAATLVGADERAGLDKGGRCQDWLETVAGGGPGMQGRDAGRPVDWFVDAPFARADEQPDSLFYAITRTLPHVDRVASGVIAERYAGLLVADGRVLDLMASVQSHLPDGMPLEVTGLGMNEEELAQNPRLSARVVHDLNAESRLPFEDASFDAVVCSLSVEYLVRPFEVFAEVARVLKPGGTFAVSFSNRWFPPKAIALWGQLHEFERPGLVLEYFLKDGLFSDLETFSLRGRWRPEDDAYADSMPFSDPVWLVWGRRA